MNEGEIKMQAKMFSLVAKMYSLNAAIEGMKAANIERRSQGYTLAYAEGSFFAAELDLQDISAKLESEI